MWETVGCWLLNLTLLGSLWVLIALCGPEIRLGELGARILRFLSVCSMRPRTWAQCAVAWRFQQLKKERECVIKSNFGGRGLTFHPCSCLFAIATQGMVHLALSSSALVTSRRAHHKAENAPGMPWYLAKVDVAHLTGDVDLPVLHALIALWRAVLKLPTPELNNIDWQLRRRYPYREVSATSLKYSCPPERRIEIISRRLLHKIHLTIYHKAQINIASCARSSVEPAAVFLFIALPGLALIRYLFGATLGRAMLIAPVVLTCCRFLHQRALRHSPRPCMQPDNDERIDYVDRLVRAIGDLVATDYVNFINFDEVAVKVFNLHNAQAECAEREAVVHEAIVAAILLHAELEWRSVELRLAYFAFWRQRRNDSKRGSGWFCRSA